MSLQRKIAYGWIFFSIIFVVSTIVIYIQNTSKQSQDLIKQSILQEAIAHFDNMVILRMWNTNHGGVYVKQHDGLAPNPYLKDNILKSDKNETLIKINPAWMTRQVSDISNLLNQYKYKITSLEPINPLNIPDEFEKEALIFLENNLSEKYYYKFGTNKDGKKTFDFLGGLKVQQNCLQCHGVQGYKVGDIRGGIRVSIPIQTYSDSLELNKQKTFKIIILVILLGVLVLIFSSYLMNKNFKYQYKLTRDKERFQKRLDLQNNLVVLTNGYKIRYANKAFLEFFGYKTLFEFTQKNICVSSYFEKDNDYFHLGIIDKDTVWTKYLYQSKASDRFVKIVDFNGNTHIFAIYINFFESDIYILTFSDVSIKMKEYLRLEKEVILENMLMAQARVSAMGEMTKMISHQWKQPLTVLNMINGNMRVDLELGDLDQKTLIDYNDQLEEQLHKLSELIDIFQKLYNKSGKVDINVNLSELIYYTLTLKHKSFEEDNIKVKVHLEKSLYLDTLSEDLTQILIHLLDNARDAIIKNVKDGGLIKVILKTKDDFYVISVEDNGGGIDTNIINSIFEPYFTTKDEYNEAGLSLFIVKMLLERHLNGSIQVANTKNGAKFTILLKIQNKRNQNGKTKRVDKNN